MGLADPYMDMTVENSELPFLVDSGARYSTINSPNFNTCISRNTVSVIGFSGKIEQVPLTTPLNTGIAGQIFFHQYILAPQSPANLMGRDVLVKANASILCSPDGLIISFPDCTRLNCSLFNIKTGSQMMLAQSTEAEATLYATI